MSLEPDGWMVTNANGEIYRLKVYKYRGTAAHWARTWSTRRGSKERPVYRVAPVFLGPLEAP